MINTITTITRSPPPPAWAGSMASRTNSPKDSTRRGQVCWTFCRDPNAAGIWTTAATALMAKKDRKSFRRWWNRGAKLDIRDQGSRDTENPASMIAGVNTWQALDYADGLVRFGVQSAADPSGLIRKLMTERGLPVPPPNWRVHPPHRGRSGRNASGIRLP